MHLRIKGIHYVGFRENPNNGNEHEMCSLIISGRGFDCLCATAVSVAEVIGDGCHTADYPTISVTPMGSSGSHGDMALITVGPPCRHRTDHVVDPGNIDELEVTVTNPTAPESDTESIPMPPAPGSDPGPGP